MQRKGYILRKSFSLIYTLIFLVVIALVGMMIMEFSAYSTRHTTRSFLDTKAELILRSATEYAIMALQGHDYSNGRINEINMTYPGFIVHTKFHYFTTNCNSGAKDCSLISTQETNMSVLVYVTVETKNPAFHIRKVRITLQNP